jgi:hypothetical protein
MACLSGNMVAAGKIKLSGKKELGAVSFSG